MDAIEIKNDGATVDAFTPYHPDFPVQAKRLGGKWSAEKRAWQFDPRNESLVRDLCHKIFGTDGTSVHLITVRLTATQRHYRLQGGIFFAGRCLAAARGRDSGAQLGPGVIVLDGRVGSCGSMKNWGTAIEAGAILLARDVPRPAVETADRDGWTVEIIEPEANQLERKES